MEKSFKILPPMMPDFISYEAPVRTKQEGFSPGANQIPVSDLSEAEALEYAELMRVEFVRHWANKVKEKIKEKW